MGIELEVNQSIVALRGPWERLRAELVDSLEKALRRRIVERLPAGGAHDGDVMRALHHSSGGSSWKTLRVPSSHCRVSASK